jgi:NAD(P)-dependent dehydrogenase (short-subunit alcohol dehydrogenase family)
VPTYNSGTRDPFSTTREYLFDLYANFTINYMILVRSLFKKITSKGHIIYISTASANVATDMVDYSAAKGAMQNYIRSLSKKVKEDQVIFSIAPSMIFESMPYYQHINGTKDENNPNYNDISKLVKKEDIAKLIVDADKSYNGKIFCLGFTPAKLDIV